ncbi:50S ribosomal protein L24 [Streptococcus agalactiae]|nr:50S ribosomal protein L24 [Streptococcus agalactiae]AUO86332.1 50S ribosomal protein L24 [Streptococcus agalactiae]AUP04350.1 50S ribosomal protein L24 [Streptococcus agalactiae]AUP06009.1 50S ribosomal protein L24 [Streptococcus agalactiae]AUP09154.1 50S ribosomal protein L24 [Streptococcus agalactiae]
MFVKKGDKVRVIAGKDKGTEAVVLKALPKVNKVVVEGVASSRNIKNQITKTLKALSLKKKLQSMCQTFKFLIKMV